MPNIHLAPDASYRFDRNSAGVFTACRTGELVGKGVKLKDKKEGGRRSRDTPLYDTKRWLQSKKRKSVPPTTKSQ
jgi:hypothetical protein